MLDNFLPHTCLCCGNFFRSALRLCPACADRIVFYHGAHSSKDMSVWGDIYLDEYEVMAHYDPVLGTLIRHLKYTGIQPLANLLGEWLWWWCKLPWEVDLICHVPLHPQRFSQRGFNQSLLLARVLSEKSNWTRLPLLERRIYTLNQAAADHQTRQKQLHGVFATRAQFQEVVKGKTVLIVDDVMTTGSTFNQCARALKEAGARHVVAVALAHKDS
ncbi:ComF family protein [Microgenomates group bacterium]|nr:ComF family protein [Microgenomates group bacterium]